MGNGHDLIDSSMLDLFRTEVETYVAILNDGLLALENDPSATDKLEPLMRAAHSIKGGARIVELDRAVKVAHAMEDFFVAAQKRQVSLGSDQIDILLKGVDILTQISAAPGEAIQDWLTQHKTEIDQVNTSLSAILTGESSKPEPPKAVSQAPEQPPQPPPSVRPSSDPALVPLDDKEERAVSEKIGEAKPYHTEIEDKDRMVRVTAGKIERLMGQAGEVVVSSRWLPPFSSSLLDLKKNHIEMLNILEGLRDGLEQKKEDKHIQELLLNAREKAKE